MRLGVIGCGKMGSALIKGAVIEGAIQGDEVMVFDTFRESAEVLSKQVGAQIANSSNDLVRDSEAVLVCVKPQDIISLTSSLDRDRDGILFISIAAGVKIHDLEKSLLKEDRVIRVMPNTPAMIGKGASAQSRGSNATESDAKFVANIHDEWQIQVTESQADCVGRLGVESIEQASNYFNMRCPLTGEYKIGDNWYETH